jgi:hypothetical protein
MGPTPHLDAFGEENFLFIAGIGRVICCQAPDPVIILEIGDVNIADFERITLLSFCAQ